MVGICIQLHVIGNVFYLTFTDVFVIFFTFFNVFTALHVMQTWYSDENSVRPSVCLSVTCVIPDKMEERSVQIFTPHERTFSLVF